VFGFFKRRRRAGPLAAEFPGEWEDIIARNVRYYACLPAADRRELQSLIQVFLAEKSFEGCDGLELTDEIKVTIAAHACVLLLHRKTAVYPRLTSILVYPGPFVVKERKPLGGVMVVESEAVHLGEAWREVVVLSWEDVRDGARDVALNVALHEFAHQLDWEDGAMNGYPLLEERDRYVTWRRVLNPVFERLQRDSELGIRTAMDEYGATDPAEFFAVATECFFEKPRVLQKRHPELYEELKSFYRQDPARLVPSGPAPAT
jgi:Mlc titration factor MtfA (ptsG expression regulator)